MTPRAWRRRLDFRFDETTYFLRKALDPATSRYRSLTAGHEAIGHARALWRIALRMTRFDRAAVLALET